MSCSVRKKGPKCASKYSFSRRAWLLGADQRSTGLVVTRTNTRPEEHAAMKAREKTTTQPGFRTQKEPQRAKSRLKQPSNAAPSGSQQAASPGRAGRKAAQLGARPRRSGAGQHQRGGCTWREQRPPRPSASPSPSPALSYLSALEATLLACPRPRAHPAEDGRSHTGL